MRYLLLFGAVIAVIYALSEQDPVLTLDPQNIYVVDGDTVDIDGLRYRLSGFDTPETYRSQCASELQLGNQATARLTQLINGESALELRTSGSFDKYGRGIARLYVDNRDVGDLLIEEGLARPYSGGQRRSWC